MAVALVAGLLTACGDDDDEQQATATNDVGASTVAETPGAATPTGDAGGAPTATEEPASPTEAAESATSTSEATAAPTETVGEQLTLNVYFMRGEYLSVAHRTIPRTQAVGAAAMQLLLEGPTDFEAGLDFTTAIPEGTEYLGLEIEDGVATVDLSSEYESGGGSLSMSARLAQVIFTLTQFPTVDAVQFLLDGDPVEVFSGEGIILDHPVGRDFEQLQPPIFVESVAVGDFIESPVTLAGTANVFEATFAVRIVSDEAGIITEQVVTATSGTGTRGTFQTKVPFDVEAEIPGKVVVLEYSAQDGTPVNIIEIPVTLKP
jgi:spore germination protein GerM